MRSCRRRIANPRCFRVPVRPGILHPRPEQRLRRRSQPTPIRVSACGWLRTLDQRPLICRSLQQSSTTTSGSQPVSATSAPPQELDPKEAAETESLDSPDGGSPLPTQGDRTRTTNRQELRRKRTGQKRHARGVHASERSFISPLQKATEGGLAPICGAKQRKQLGREETGVAGVQELQNTRTLILRTILRRRVDCRLNFSATARRRAPVATQIFTRAPPWGAPELLTPDS